MGPQIPVAIQAELDKLRHLISLSLGGGLPLASGFGQPVGPFPKAIPNAATIEASAIFTPKSTGKMRVIFTGNVENSDAGGAHSFTPSLSHGANPTPADFTGDAYVVPANLGEGGASTMSFAIVVDLDKLGVTFTVGVPAQINGVLTASQANVLNLESLGALQIAVEERQS
jgi:hypothetical protein